MAKKDLEPAKIFTIGLAKKSAEVFFETLALHGITDIVDVRLFNNTQFAGFAKAPDLKFFLKRISAIEYRRDLKFTPPKDTLKNYQRELIDWDEYVAQMARKLKERRIEQHIQQNYIHASDVRYCLLCAELSPEKCHRRLIAEKFAEVFEGMEIVHL